MKPKAEEGTDSSVEHDDPETLPDGESTSFDDIYNSNDKSNANKVSQNHDQDPKDLDHETENDSKESDNVIHNKVGKLQGDQID